MPDSIKSMDDADYSNHNVAAHSDNATLDGPGIRQNRFLRPPSIGNIGANKILPNTPIDQPTSILSLKDLQLRALAGGPIALFNPYSNVNYNRDQTVTHHHHRRTRSPNHLGHTRSFSLENKHCCILEPRTRVPAPPPNTPEPDVNRLEAVSALIKLSQMVLQPNGTLQDPKEICRDEFAHKDHLGRQPKDLNLKKEESVTLQKEDPVATIHPNRHLKRTYAFYGDISELDV
uniref:Uncharacterized protein n=1 Tax=Psilocybe cubensis TaxID=181762 RepID=A0A8H8CK77_PSICU